MLEKIFIFVIFLGPLVFFHELGHFLFARFFGVRVETFSIGFGPKLFSFTRNGTTYAVSLIPLGGYVKMFGDDPLSEEKLTPEEEAVAYTKKGKWARFWIVFGGPLANFILAFVIYFSLVSFGEKVPEAKLGYIQNKSFFYEHGLRSGDTIKQINDQVITSFDDFNLIDSKVNSVTIERAGESKNFKLKSSGVGFVQKFSEISQQLRAPILINSKGDHFLLKLKNNDLRSLEELSSFIGEEIKAYKITSDLTTIESLKAIKTVEKEDYKIFVRKDLLESFAGYGLYPRDLYISSIVAKSPAEEAKLKKGDILLRLNDVSLKSFGDLRGEVQKVKVGDSVNIEILSEGKVKSIELTPLAKDLNGQKVLTIGVYSGMIVHPSRMVVNKSEGIFKSFSQAWNRTAIGIVKTVSGFKKLITGEVSVKNIGGPIAIGKVASDSFNISLSMFFRLMALISINLGIINLFPIPVLDGGHIVFIFLELINGGPLSRKKMMYAQQVGLSLLFALIFFSLFNDFSRFF